MQETVNFSIKVSNNYEVISELVKNALDTTANNLGEDNFIAWNTKTVCDSSEQRVYNENDDDKMYFDDYWNVIIGLFAVLKKQKPQAKFEGSIRYHNDKGGLEGVEASCDFSYLNGTINASFEEDYGEESDLEDLIYGLHNEGLNETDIAEITKIDIDEITEILENNEDFDLF